MNGLDHSLSFKDLILRVAELVGVADFSNGPAAIPTDPHDLDKVKRSINEAQRFIALDNPKLRRLRQRRFEIVTSADGTGPQCVHGSPTRYWLPLGFTGETFGQWRWSVEGSGYAGQANDATFTAVQGRLDSSPGLTGAPQLVAVEPFTPQPGQNAAVNRFVLVVSPVPAQAFTLRNTGRFFPYPMVELEDRTVLGATFDDALIYKAAAVFHAGGEEQARFEALAAPLLAKAADYDRRSGPRDLGDMGDPEATDDSDDTSDGARDRNTTGAPMIDGVLVSQ